MDFTFFLLLVSFVVDVLAVRRKNPVDKDLEILALRHQVRLLQRKLDHTPRLSRIEKILLAVLAVRFRASVQGVRERLNQSLLLFKPETMFKWHRELVARKWTFAHTAKVGRPRTALGIEHAVVRMAKENPTWGADRLQGELLKIGIELGPTTIRDILERHGIPPALERTRQGSSWNTLLSHYKEQMLACDFFTIETAWLKTLYVLFFIEIGSRVVYLAGCTDHPTSAWVTQQARNLVERLEQRPTLRFLIHDRDTKFSAAFDTVFAAEHLTLLKTPPRAPNANAFAERWVRSIREECLDRVLIINQAHLKRVLRVYIDHYNRARPHQGIAQQLPIPAAPMSPCGAIERRDRLGGILHEYYRAA